MGSLTADVDPFPGPQAKGLRGGREMGSQTGAVGFTQVDMHCSILIKRVRPAFGELHKVIREEDAAHRLRCHPTHTVDRNNPLGANLPGSRDDGSVVDLMGRKVSSAMARNESKPLAFYPAANDGDGTVSCIHLICYPIQAEAHSADDCDFSIHEMSCSSNLNYLSIRI